MYSPGRFTRGGGAAGLIALALFCRGSGAAREVSLSLEDLVTPVFSAKSVTAVLSDGPSASLTLAIGELALNGRSWRSVRIACPRFTFDGAAVDCSEGILDAGEKVPVSFSYSAGAFDASLRPAAGGVWRIRARPAAQGYDVDIAVENGALTRVAPWLPPVLPRISAGAITGSMRFATAQAPALGGELAVRGLAFSDASGLHAGEKIDATVKVKSDRHAGAWRWQAEVAWNGGEVFWQPLYLRGDGHTLIADGTLEQQRIAIARSAVKLAGVGEVEASGVWDRRTGAVTSADVRSGALDVAALYARVLKPFFFGTALGDLRADGGIQVALRIRDARLESVNVAVDKLSFEDTGRRFAVFGASGRIPWHRSEETKVELEMKGGELLRMPLGAVKLPLTMHGMRFRLESVEIPLLDGKLTMRGFATEPPEQGWRWAFRANISPISMERFTQAVGLPTMHGTISAEIPRVSYSRSTLRVDGALVFKVFDGTVTAKDVTLIEPLGKAPRLTADLEARGIDLDLLTRTFSFGNITGRIDAAVKSLQLVNWQPVGFDARVESSPGEYPRKISQTAVQNISALGGAGAAAAIQRTFLRFFEQFGYRNLGWSCRLRDGVCEMGGVEDAEYGYVIVKGGGIPAITVMGYNRRVDWHELVDRLKRVMQDNVRAIVK